MIRQHPVRWALVEVLDAFLLVVDEGGDWQPEGAGAAAMPATGRRLVEAGAAGSCDGQGLCVLIGSPAEAAADAGNPACL